MAASQLSIGQRIFNQRLLAEHCMTEKDCRQLYEELREENDYEMDENLSFQDSIAMSNTQLQYLGLEIVAVSMPMSTSSNDEGNDEEEDEEEEDEEDDDSEDNSPNKKRTKHVRYYAMINKFPDNIAKKAFQEKFFHPPQQQLLVKAIFAKIVADGNSVSKTTLLNLKNELPNNDDEGNGKNANNPVTLAIAEDILARLVQEKWLVMVQVKSGGDGQRRNRSTSSSQNIGLGARTYCELSHLLTDEFGMRQEELPQLISLHR